MEHYCNICKKPYKNYKSLWKHKYIYHTEKKPDDVNDVVNDVNVPVNIPVNVKSKKEDIKYCLTCKKPFKSRQGKWAHERICKKEITIEDNKMDLVIKENIDIKKELSEYKKEMENLKNLLQKSLKIHPKTLNKINNQLNNNGTINNITIIQLGQENLSEILNTRQKKNILNRQAMSLNDLVDLVHVSGKYKEFQNVYITNLQSTFAYKFDEKANKFIAVNKNELLNDLVDSRMYDIEKFYEEICPDLEPHRAEQIKRFIDRMGDDEDELKGIKKEEIKLILYNNKDKIMPKDDIVV